MTCRKKRRSVFIATGLMEYGLTMPKRDLFFFNRYANTLGNRETGSIEELSLESFEGVNEIPLDGILVHNGNHTTDVYFYSEESNPYRNATLDLEALKQYNRFIYPLSILLNRTL